MPRPVLWLWRNGEGQFFAYDNEYPTLDGGDPLTLGEPIGFAILMDSTGRDGTTPTRTASERLIDEMLGAQSRFVQAWKDDRPIVSIRLEEQKRRDTARKALMDLICGESSR